MKSKIRITALFLICMTLMSEMSLAETDPGIRGGAPGAGQPLPGLTAQQAAFFGAGAGAFARPHNVPAGLGPRFNLDTCGGCHGFPALGGTDGPTNPQPAVATALGGANVVPQFVTATGPIRVVRFVNKSDGTPDGSVHSLFTIRGRTDAPASCNILQDNFDAEAAVGNVRFRLTTPVFGAGLIEGISEEAILQNKTTAASTVLGISGKENRDSEGRIGRFGWKAQHGSLLKFSGEASLAEMGVTNMQFTRERDVAAADLGCVTNPQPEKNPNFTATAPQAALDDITSLTVWMQFLAAPVPSTTIPGGAASIARGRTLFQQIGCANCHTPTFVTGPHRVAALSNRPVPLFSDLLLHNMGAGLADNISQGLATGDQFRTAPLWGLGQRRFFLHDGRTNNLVEAILLHASPAAGGFPASEANTTINNYNALPDFQQQDIINFLRSL